MKHKKILEFDNDLFEKIETFKSENNIPTFVGAVRFLLEKGLTNGNYSDNDLNERFKRLKQILLDHIKNENIHLLGDDDE